METSSNSAGYYNGLATFSSQDEVIAESSCNFLSDNCANLFSSSFLGLCLTSKRKKQAKKVERILCGSNCRELIRSTHGIITINFLERLLELEKRVTALEEMKDAGVRVAESGEDIIHTSEASKDDTHRLTALEEMKDAGVRVAESGEDIIHTSEASKDDMHRLDSLVENIVKTKTDSLVENIIKTKTDSLVPKHSSGEHIVTLFKPAYVYSE